MKRIATAMRVRIFLLPSAELSEVLPMYQFKWAILVVGIINARIDMGWGKDDHGIYFSIGEAY